MNRRTCSFLVVAGLVVAPASLWGQALPPAAVVSNPRVLLGVLAERTAASAERPGIRVMEVTPGSPAATAGVQPGDLIVKIGPVAVNTIEAFFRALASHKPGDKVPVDVFRDGKEQHLTVTLAQRGGGGVEVPREPSGAFLGVDSQPLTPAAKQRLGVSVDAGVVVLE